MTQSNTENKFLPLCKGQKWLAQGIINIAFSLHKTLVPGPLGSVYEKCFCYEFTKRNIPYIKQQPVQIIYDNRLIDDGLKLDLQVDNLIIIELKAQENSHPVWEAQLLSYLKLTQKRLGYIFNFHVSLMKDGIKRRIP